MILCLRQKKFKGPTSRTRLPRYPDVAYNWDHLSLFLNRIDGHCATTRCDGEHNLGDIVCVRADSFNLN